MSTTRRALVYTSGVLPISETFVADQARGLQRWDTSLVGRYRVHGGLEVDDLLAQEMHALPSGRRWFREHSEQITRRVPVLRTVASRLEPQLIHAHFLTGGFDVLATLPELPCPVVVTAHGFDATWHGSPLRTIRPQQWFHGLLRRRLLRSDIHFIAVSTFIGEQLVRYGAPPHRVTVHHTGVDTEYFSPPADSGSSRQGVLFVGRLVEKKGILDLLAAVTSLRRRGRPLSVEIIGDGPLRPSVERHIRESGVDAVVRGWRSRPEVRQAMRRAAILCNPSRTARSGDREGFGMVLAEAQATGLPVVATRCGGMVDAVADGRTGILVEEGDVAALAHSIETLASDDGLHAHLSGEARSWAVEKFSLRRQNSELEDLYDRWAGISR